MAIEPTPEAYEAALAAMSGRIYGSAGWLDALQEADVRAAVDVTWPLAEAQVRAQVAAQIRAKSLGWCMDGTGRHLVENCARIAEGKGDET